MTTTLIALHRDRLAAALQADPFPWQAGLLEAMLAGRLPPALDVPTGLGKTAVMAIWLVARAAGAPVPRRLVYVVDRRAVVDQATTIAERLRDWVTSDQGVQRDLGLSGPLAISTLRGQFLDNRQWLADPSRPAIVLGTVDMIGSRMLFEGYGVTRRMRPYHAGLLGTDTLLVLDEAHLVQPFERLIEAIASGQQRAPSPSGLGSDPTLRRLLPPFRGLSLSATGRPRLGAFTLGPDDAKTEVVNLRLHARKGLELREPVKAGDLASALADAAWQLSGAGSRAIRCLVFCNRRRDAQSVRDDLTKRGATLDTPPSVELLVGARRAYERTGSYLRLQALGFVPGKIPVTPKLTFLVATSAGEVGVDLDAEHMVGDVVAWERLVQRLGRVNRRGAGDARVVLIPVQADSENPVQPTVEDVLTVLRELPTRESTSELDASPSRLRDLTKRAMCDAALQARLVAATTQAPLHPPLTRAVVESWSMTSIDTHTGRPEVQPWLRGWIEDDQPQTTLVWRRHLPLLADGTLLPGEWLDSYRETADPHSAERLEAVTNDVFDWLKKRCQAIEKQGIHVPGGAHGSRPSGAMGVLGVVLGGRSELRLVTWADLDNRKALERDLADALLLLDARLGGLTDGLLDTNSDHALDLTAGSDPTQFALRMFTSDTPAAPATSGWRPEAEIPVRFDNDSAAIEWLVIESAASVPPTGEASRSFSCRRAQLLDEHQEWTAVVARDIAARLGLPKPYADMLELAARLHDEGTRAPQWKLAFGVSGDLDYGKTTNRPRPALLRGYRHELGSLPRAEADARLSSLPPDLRDLCLHLIAAHHGNARPILTTENAEEPPSRLKKRAQEIALRFTNLEQRWGPWGLAWWEALLRAADQTASRQNDEEVARG